MQNGNTSEDSPDSPSIDRLSVELRNVFEAHGFTNYELTLTLKGTGMESTVITLEAIGDHEEPAESGLQGALAVFSDAEPT